MPSEMKLKKSRLAPRAAKHRTPAVGAAQINSLLTLFHSRHALTQHSINKYDFGRHTQIEDAVEAEAYKKQFYFPKKTTTSTKILNYLHARNLYALF